MGDLRFQVSDLLGHPGSHRDVHGEVKLFLKVGETTTRSSSATFAHLTAVGEGILAEGWSELFVRHPDGDQNAIASDGVIDLEGVVHDELSLALPADPLCRPHCAGICPECGADLNDAPCEGHGDLSEGPFAALKQLFGS